MNHRAALGSPAAGRCSRPGAPLAAASASSQRRDCSVRSRDASDMILIVDDDASITASLALLLKQHGYPIRVRA